MDGRRLDELFRQRGFSRDLRAAAFFCEPGDRRIPCTGWSPDAWPRWRAQTRATLPTARAAAGTPQAVDGGQNRRHGRAHLVALFGELGLDYAARR